MNTRHATTLALALLAGGAAAQGDTAALERELLADAGARASFQAGGVGGHDGKFFLASPDGAFRLNVRGQSQFRYNMNFRDVEDPDEEFSNGFNARRTKLEFSGNVMGDWNYKFVGAFDRDGGAFELEDAILDYEFDNGFTVAWGQFKLPFLREESVSSKYQLAADRSVANEVFNQDRSQLVQLGYESESFRVFGAVSDGFKTANSPYYSTAEADVALTGRGEFRFGEASWKVHEDFTSFREGAAGGLVGAAIHWETFGSTANTDTFAGTPASEMDMFSYTVDVGYEGGGWNLFGAFVGRVVDPDGGDSSDDFGALVQGGLFVTETTEVFARWDAVFPDDELAAGEDFHTLTFGANHYFIAGSHAAKFTADLQWFLNNQAESSSIVRVNEGIGLAPASEDGEIALRLQMQLLF